jgi:hypothetical protein
MLSCSAATSGICDRPRVSSEIFCSTPIGGEAGGDVGQLFVGGALQFVARNPHQVLADERQRRGRYQRREQEELGAKRKAHGYSRARARTTAVSLATPQTRPVVSRASTRTV